MTDNRIEVGLLDTGDINDIEEEESEAYLHDILELPEEAPEQEELADLESLNNLLEVPDILQPQLQARDQSLAQSPEKALINRRLSIYDIAKLIGFRASQLARGAIPLVQIDPEDPQKDDPLHIAQLEFDQSKIPFGINRKGEFNPLEHMFNPHILPKK